ncbi:plk plk-unclassified protein kinase [Nannochloropsis oceanica]
MPGTMVASAVASQPLEPTELPHQRPSSSASCASSSSASLKQQQGPSEDGEGEIIIAHIHDPTSENDLLVKKFLKGKLLGKGGFAKCYWATCLETQAHYALKIVVKASLHKSKARHRQLQTEIRIHRTLNHRHIVKFHHFFEDKQHAYILLELCHNHSMSDLLRKRKRLTEGEVQYYLLQLLDALTHLHAKGIIHRDLKLGNLFLDKHMRIKVGDLGLAAKLLSHSDRKKTMCGTPNYIAPEILESTTGHSFQVDIWSLGVIAYTLLVGRPPYECKDVKSTYQRILANRYTFPETVSVSEPAKELIRSMLQSKPEHRPSLEALGSMPFLAQVKDVVPSSLPSSCLLAPPPDGTDWLRLARLGCLSSSPSTSSSSSSRKHTAAKSSSSTETSAAAAAAVRQTSLSSSAAARRGGGRSRAPIILYHDPEEEGEDWNGEGEKENQPPLNTAATKPPPSSSSSSLKHKAPLPPTRRALASRNVNVLYSTSTRTTATAAVTAAAATATAAVAASLKKKQLSYSSSSTPAYAAGCGSSSSSSSSSSRVASLNTAPAAQRRREHHSTTPAAAPAGCTPTASRRITTKRQATGSEDALEVLQDTLARGLNDRSKLKYCPLPPFESRPQVWVNSYVDYTSKYGLGFLHNDGSAGAYFNDSTKLVVDAQGLRARYIERSSSSSSSGGSPPPPRLERHFLLEIYPPELYKKVSLVKHFRSYLLEQRERSASSKVKVSPSPPSLPPSSRRCKSTTLKGGKKGGREEGAGGEEEEAGEEERKELVYVRRWLQTKHAVMFRLSSGVIQFLFQDRTELLLSNEGRLITYANANGEREMHSISSLARLEAREGGIEEGVEVSEEEQQSARHLMKRLRYANEVLKKVLDRRQVQGGREGEREGGRV